MSSPSRRPVIQNVFELPRLKSLARHAFPRVVEATLIPLAIFYGALWLVGTWAGVAGALAWSWTAIIVRRARGRRVPGILLIGALGLTGRTALAAATHSIFFYFLQPTLGAVVLGAAFLISLPSGRPLAERLAADFVPLPEAFVAHPAVRRLFNRITLLWGLVQLVSAAVTLWLLLSQPLTIFLAARTGTSMVLTGATVAVSSLWFRRSLHRHGLLAPRPA